MDIEGLTSQVKEIALRLKSAPPPLLFMELDNGTVPELMLFENWPYPSVDAQRATLLAQGIQLGKEYQGRHIKALCFFIEGYARFVSPGAPMPSGKPSDDPASIEVISRQLLEVLPSKGADCKPSYRQRCHLIELLRDGSGEIVDLLPRESEMALIDGLLEHFLAGFEGVQLSQAELRKALGRHTSHFTAMARRGGSKRC